MAKIPTTPESPAADSARAAVVQTQDRPVANQTPKVTTRTTDAFGPRGRIADLTDNEIAAAPKGLLVDPTPEQLARRRT